MKKQNFRLRKLGFGFLTGMGVLMLLISLQTKYTKFAAIGVVFLGLSICYCGSLVASNGRFFALCVFGIGSSFASIGCGLLFGCWELAITGILFSVSLTCRIAWIDDVSKKRNNLASRILTILTFGVSVLAIVIWHVNLANCFTNPSLGVVNRPFDVILFIICLFVGIASMLYCCVILFLESLE